MTNGNLRDMNGVYHRIFRMAPYAMLIIDADDSAILEINDQAEELTGFNSVEIIGMKCWELFAQDGIDLVKRHLYQVKSEGTGESRRMTLQRVDGSTAFVEVTASTIEFDGKQLIQVICRSVEHSHGVEELKSRIEGITSELKEKQTQIIQNDKMATLGNLVAGVAHEINTPLAAFRSNTDMFARSLEKLRSVLDTDILPGGIENNEKVAKLFEAVQQLNRINTDASERIVKIVNTLRKFARLDEDQMVSVDIHEGIESTLTLVHHEIKRRITVEKEYGDIPEVECYPNQLNQVFLNIIVNAIQAIEGEGTIRIKTYTEDNNAVVEISDTGHGIPEEILARVFESGFTTKGSGVGTGLGLSIVHEIILKHNGRIEVDTEVGRGTTFKIVIPIDRN